MSFKPIVLWNADVVLKSDDACTSIYSYKLPPSPSAIQPPYQPLNTISTLFYVPPLVYFCIKTLLEYPEQLHLLGSARLRYQPPSDKGDFDILQALIPTYQPFSSGQSAVDLRSVDPRLWATLIQIYNHLPDEFREYTLALSDIHMPLLQAIPSTEDFSLITVLSLPRRSELNDDTVIELRHLHSLAALDASATTLGSFGIQRLAKSLAWSEVDDEQVSQRCGPWGLRILYLKDCCNIEDTCLKWIVRFPLLSVVDLRGTVCQPWRDVTLPFKPIANTSLYDPTRMSEVLEHLASYTKSRHTLFSHRRPYILKVDSLYHRSTWPFYQGLPSRASQLGSRGWFKDERYRKHDDGWDMRKSEIDDIWDRSESEDDDNLRRSASEDDEDRSRSEHDDDLSEDEEEQPPRPYDMSDHQFGEDLRSRRIRQEPDPDAEPASWMNEVAGQEHTAYVKQRIIDKFYGPRRSLSILQRARSWRDVPSNHLPTITASFDRLMLFRTPPPWSSLPSLRPTKPASQSAGQLAMPQSSSSMPASVFSASSIAFKLQAADSHSPVNKRKRTQSEDVAPADKVRKGMRAISSMQSMFSLMQKRADSLAKAPSPSDASTSTCPPRARPSANPFVRGRTASSASSLKALAGQLRRAHPPPATSSSSSKPTAGTSSATKVEKMSAPVPPIKRSLPDETKPDPPRPAKKLKPISTLTVPDWPTSSLKPLSAHRLKLPDKRSVQSKMQTTLSTKPVSREKDSVARAERRVSAPLPAPTGRIEVVPDKAGLSGKRDTNRNKSASVKPSSKTSKGKETSRSSGGGKGFDWKGWSGTRN